MRKTYLLLAALLAVAGICVMLWPVFTGNRLQSSAATAVQEFLAERNEPEQQYPELLADLQAYNRVSVPKSNQVLLIWKPAKRLPLT